MVAVGLSCGGCLSCGGGCVIAADNFNRADADDINDGAPFEWGGDNGNIQIFDNEIIIFSGTPEQLTCPTANPDSTGSGYVTATYRADAGDEVEVWLNGSDADNCTVARLTVGSPGTLEILDRTSGSDTSLASVSTSTSAYDTRGIALYYDATTRVAKAVSGASVCALGVDEKGYLAGISIGSNSGAVYVDDFSYQKLGDGENGCPELTGCEVNGCGTVIDSSWEAVLDVSGSANGSCSGCATINVPIVCPLTSNGTTFKEWKFVNASATGICAFDVKLEAGVQINCDPGPSYSIFVYVQVNVSGFVSNINFFLDLGSTPPNLAAVYPSSLFSASLAGTGGWCNFSGLTLNLSFNPP